MARKLHVEAALMSYNHVIINNKHTADALLPVLQTLTPQQCKLRDYG